MSDDSDDPVMALLATQRAMLAAIENLASQVETMQGTLAQLVASSANASCPGASRVLSLGDRFRKVAGKEAMADPALRAAYSHYVVAQVIAQQLHRNDPAMVDRETRKARGWIADQLDQGRQFDMAKTRRREDGVAHAVIEPIHEEMFAGRVRVKTYPSR